MQYVHGRDLGDVLDRAYERGEPMPQGLGLYITDQLLRGLDYVHNLKDEHGRHMGLVHRDISPQNVLIGFDGAVKLIDFGLARTDVLPARTQGALAVGKYGYMSPEQARHENIDGRADLYSAGVMLFEVFTGDRLVDEQDQATLWQRVLNPKHRSPKTVVPTLPDVVEQLIMRAVQVRPESRFESARQMREFAAQVSGPDTSRESLVRYLRYLYPKVDFNAPPIPKFDDLVGGTEQSIIIATSDKGALSVFGRGDLPIEWTMQLDSKQIREAVEESRRQAALRQRDEPITDANMNASEIQLAADPTLLRTSVQEFMSSGERTAPGGAASPADDRTQVSRRPPSTTTNETTRYVRAPTEQREPDRSRRPADAGPAAAPVAGLPVGAVRGGPYRDDEMTVMMDAPPQARALFEGETPTRLSKIREEAPSPTVQSMPAVSAPAKAGPTTQRRTRAIKEKNTSQDRVIRPERPVQSQTWRKKAIEVHRRTVPVEPMTAPEPRPPREQFAPAAIEATMSRKPFPWMMWGIGLLGLAFLVVVAVVVAVAI